ncbi:MAG: GtrA family protein [Kiritimatiellia bacterium]
MTRDGLRARIAGWLSHDTHPAVQFVKYAATGGLATVLYVATELLAERYLFPTAPAARAGSASPIFWTTSVAFVITMAVVYPLNRMFVFRPGRHSRVMEFLYFCGFAVVGSTAGTLIGSYLVQTRGIPNHIAIFSTVFTSAMVNYAGRKFFVFKG